MDPTLVVLAAGIGQRYGGLKQLEPVGPDGSALMEYGIYDAIRAGFDKIVFVIRPEIESLLKDHAASRYARHVNLTYVVQSLEKHLPDPAVITGRTKPWGTGHAVLCVEDSVTAPFAVINADDFYGAAAFSELSSFLGKLSDAASNSYALVGYRLHSTLSDGGTVSRGVCRRAPNGWLAGIEEITKIERHGVDARYVDSNGTEQILDGDTTVSMNTWGLAPSVFDLLRERFEAFFAGSQDLETAEFYLPTAINDAILRGTVQVKLLPSTDSWCGVTYPQDKQLVIEHIQHLVERGEYPRDLWE